MPFPNAEFLRYMTPRDRIPIRARQQHVFFMRLFFDTEIAGISRIRNRLLSQHSEASNMLKSFVIAIALLFSPMAHAQDWIFVGSGEGVSVDVDKASIRRTSYIGPPSVVEAWSRWNYSSSQSIDGTGLIWKTKYRSQKMLHWYDCGRATSALRQVISYSKPDGRGDVVESLSFERNATYSAEAPDTLGRFVLDYACR